MELEIFFKLMDGFLSEGSKEKKKEIIRSLYTFLKKLKFDDDKGIEATDSKIFNEAELEKKKNLVDEYLIKYSGYLKCLRLQI